MNDLLNAKKDMTRAMDETKMDITKLRFSLNKQHGVNIQTEDAFNMYQGKIIEAVVEAKEVKDQNEINFEEMLEK